MPSTGSPSDTAAGELLSQDHASAFWHIPSQRTAPPSPVPSPAESSEVI